MTSKQLVQRLIKQIGDEYIIGGISDESLELAIKLAQSFETEQERNERINKFGLIVNEAAQFSKKYSPSKV